MIDHLLYIYYINGKVVMRRLKIRDIKFKNKRFNIYKRYNEYN